mmetsp:Transcript_23890/g.36368  ORF Transcript_23890/g.36368 Transcript_23890/m.36368 type:complete len:254 (+) Transcript_23890:517-1278(+)
MLHTLGKGIVGSLCHTQSIHDVKVSTFTLQRLDGILSQLLSTGQRIDDHTEGLGRVLLVQCRTGLMRLLGHNVKISGCTEVGKTCLTLLTQILANGIHGKGYLHMKSAIEVGITSNSEFLSRVQWHNPITDTGCISEKIASTGSIQFIIILQFRLLHTLEGEGDGTTALSGDGNKTLPDTRSVQIDSNDIGTESHEDEEWSHGRSGTEKYKVSIAQIEVSWIVNTLLDGNTGTLLNASVGNPLINLCLQSFTR